MATHWSTYLLCPEDQRITTIKDSSKTIVNCEGSDFTLDGVCNTAKELWSSLEPHIVGNVDEGVGTCVVFIGDADFAVMTLKQMVKESVVRLAPTERMKLLEINRTGMVSAFEINSSEKIKDALEKDSVFSDAKVRGGRIETLTETPTNPSTLDTFLNYAPLTDSCFGCDIANRLTNGVQIRTSQLMFMAVPTSKAFRRVAGNSLCQVLEALQEQSSRKKKGFVPYRLSAATQLLSEPFNSNPSKVIIIGCHTKDSNEEICALIKILHRSRLITSILRGTEETVSDHNLKNIIEKLKRKLVESSRHATLSIEQPSQPSSPTSPVSTAHADLIAQKHLVLQQRELEAKLARRRFEEAQQILTVSQSRLAAVKQSAAGTKEARRELSTVAHEHSVASRKLEDEQKSSELVEDSMEEARLLEQEVTAENETRRKLKEAAAEERAIAQAKTLASVFRAAHQSGLDQRTATQATVDSDKIKSELSKCDIEIERLEDEISNAKIRLQEAESFAAETSDILVKTEYFQNKITSDIRDTLTAIITFAETLESASLETFANISDVESAFNAEVEAEVKKIDQLRADLTTRVVNPLPSSKASTSSDLQQSVDALICFLVAEEERSSKLSNEKSKISAEIDRLVSDPISVALQAAKSDYLVMEERYQTAITRLERLAKNTTELNTYVRGRERL